MSASYTSPILYNLHLHLKRRPTEEPYKCVIQPPVRGRYYPISRYTMDRESGWRIERGNKEKENKTEARHRVYLKIIRLHSLEERVRNSEKREGEIGEET